MSVTDAPSVINRRPLSLEVSLHVEAPNKRRKKIDGSHSAFSTTRPISPELRELLEQNQRQVSTPTGKYRNPFSTPLPLHDSPLTSMTMEGVEDVVREQLQQENCMDLPDFVGNCENGTCEGDQNPYDTDDVPTLQRFFLFCKVFVC